MITTVNCNSHSEQEYDWAWLQNRNKNLFLFNKLISIVTIKILFLNIWLANWVNKRYFNLELRLSYIRISPLFIYAYLYIKQTSDWMSESNDIRSPCTNPVQEYVSHHQVGTLYVDHVLSICVSSCHIS